MNNSASTSPAFAHFRQQFFGPIDQYLAWHDGYEADLAALDALTPAERTAAEQELIAGLQARTTDARAVIGLGYLRSRAALPVLHEMLPAYGMYVLPAIAQIDAQALDAARLDALLRTKLSEYTLLDMLVGLRHGFTLTQLPPALPATVLTLLAHSDYLVRYHALATLRQLYHLPAPAETLSSPQPADELFDLIRSDKQRRHYQQAQQLIRAQIKAQGYAL